MVLLKGRRREHAEQCLDPMPLVADAVQASSASSTLPAERDGTRPEFRVPPLRALVRDVTARRDDGPSTR